MKQDIHQISQQLQQLQSKSMSKDLQGQEEIIQDQNDINFAGSELGQMKRGDYMIHVFVERVKEIKVPEGDDTVDPIIETQCFKQRQYTSAKKDISGISEVIFSEHMFLEQRNVEKKDAEEAKVTIKLMDKGFLKDALIGLFEFDLSFIYFRKNHVLLHQWLALSNPNSENYSDITAYIKVSISVAASGDEQVEITEEDGPGDEKNVMMPPQLNPKFYQVILRFFQAQDLAPMDRATIVNNAKIDAYLLTEYKKKKLKTNVIVMEDHEDKSLKVIDWNQEFWIPAQIPIISGRLVVKLMDKETLGSDQTAGSILFDIQDLIKHNLVERVSEDNDGDLENPEHSSFIWKNIYGSPLNQSDSEAKRQANLNPELGSTWKGRVLVQIVVRETENPQAKVCEVKESIVRQSVPYLEKREYEVIAEVGQAINLPTDKKYTVKLIVGGFTLPDPDPEKKTIQKGNYIQFNKRFEMTNKEGRSLKLPYQNIDRIGQVFLALLDEQGQQVSYYKESISNFKLQAGDSEGNTEPEYRWIQLLPDLCVNKVKEAKDAGMISFKMSVHKVGRENGRPVYNDFKSYDAWREKAPQRLDPIKIRAYIYQARDLPAADATGTSDPYITIWDVPCKPQDLEERPKKTKVIEESTNPQFYEVIELTYLVRKSQDLNTYPPLIFDVFDEDKVLGRSKKEFDDFLGRASINLSEVDERALLNLLDDGNNYDSMVPTRPQWHPIRFAEGEPTCGEILVSFSISTLDFNYKMPIQAVNLKSQVEFQKFDVDMLILGLRNLQSAGMLPVKKALVQFNIKSLVPPDSTAVENIRTQPGPTGPNPTINTTMKFQIPLPTDPLFCPQLSCMVYDYIFKGWNQPMIGTFVVPIGKLMQDLQKQQDLEMAKMGDIIAKLENLMEMNGIFQKHVSMEGSFQSMRSSLSRSGSKVDNQSELNINFSEQDSSIREESDGDDQERRKKNKKMKQKYQRKLKDSQIVVEDGALEQMGVSEADGITNALNKKNENFNMAKERRKSLMNSGKQETNNVGFGQMGKRKSTVDRSQSKQLSKAEVMQLIKGEHDKEKRILEDERQRALNEFWRQKRRQNKSGQEQGQGQHCVIFPEYEFDERLQVYKEALPPPEELYMGLGWDEDKDSNSKHYRLFYNDELENIKDIFPRPSSEAPFSTFHLKRGQSRGVKQSVFSKMFKTLKKDESGQDSTERFVGLFKGIIHIESKTAKKEFFKTKQMKIKKLLSLINQISEHYTGEQVMIQKDLAKMVSPIERNELEQKLCEIQCGDLQIPQSLASLESDENLKRALLAQVKCTVRLYVIEAFDLASRDIGSPSDPYLYIKCNNKVFNERNNYQLDEPNPKFHQHFDFEGTFPGCSPLQIDLFDYDEVFGDDLIGTTIVDLEDRYFSQEWQSLQDKPIEYRQIYHQSSTISQGVVKCWVEINPINLQPQPTVWNISEKPPEEFEVRVCVFKGSEIEMMDNEGTSDVYFRGFFDTAEDVQETDTHYRNQDGKPDFQYRLVYRIKRPRKDYKFTIQCYDRDFFKRNDMIGEASIQLKNLIEDCSLIKKPLQYNEKYHESVQKDKDKHLSKIKFDEEEKSRFWMTLKHKDSDSGQIKNRGEVCIQIDVLPAEVSDKNKVGKARQEPNHSPYLPQPQGRVQMTMNPMKMYQQMIGPDVRNEIFKYLLMAICVILCLSMLPQILGNIMTSMVCGVTGLGC